MPRPRIKLKTTIFGYIIESLSIMTILGLIIIPIIYYEHLPKLMPSHYSILGQPDAFNPRGSIFILPIVAILIYSGISTLQKFPHIFNYPVEVTETNARHLYSTGVMGLRLIKFITILVFFYITYSTIQVALGYGNGINMWIILFLISSIIFILIYFIIRMCSKSIK